MNELRAKEYTVGGAARPPAAEPADAGFAPSELLAVLWRRKYLILAIVIASIAIALAWASARPPLYTSTATIMLDVSQPQLADMESMVGGISADVRAINSQLQVIESRNLMGRVVDVMNLTEDPEFNPWLAAEQATDGAFWAGWLSPDAWRARLGMADPDGPAMVPAPTPQKIREFAVNTLIEQTIVVPLNLSYVFYVSVETQDPVKSAALANAIAEQYILNQIAVKYEATEKATIWLSERLVELKQTLEEAEAAVAEFRAANAHVSDEAVQALAQRLISLKATQADVAQGRVAAEARLAELEALLPTGKIVEIAEVAGSIRLENLAETIVENGGPDAEENATALSRFDAEVQSVIARLNREVAQSEQSIGKLAATIVDLEGRQEEQAAARVRLQQLEREAAAASVIYETFLSRQKETSVQQGAHTADAQVISEAWVPNRRSWPRYHIVLGVALLAAAVLVGLLIMLLEAIDQTFSTPEELERFTGLPVLGLIPSAPITARSNMLKYTASRPTSPFVEAVRNLRTSVQLAGVDGDIKVVTMTSAVEGEGKTALAMALGHVSAAQANRRVLVMDCDLRRRQLTRILGGGGLPGIIACFSGSKSLDEIIHRVDGSQFDIVFADKSPKITADIFASQRFEDLVKEMRQRYDLVVIDTPPVLALTDVRVIARHADMVLFAASWKKTRRGVVRTALAALEPANPRKIAMVFNRMNIAKSIGYYGGRHYYKS